MATRTRNRPKGIAYGYPNARAGMVGPIPRTSGDLDPLEFVKENKWYFLGGGLLVAAAVAWKMGK